jgi:hypothetical protein
MHRYQPGTWYPYLERSSMRIADPKTTAVVGGTICALADRRIRNLMVHTDKLQMRSTAKYIGILETNGMLSESKVLFGSEDEKRRTATVAAGPFDYSSRMTIGFRQLPYERWTATPLYQLSEAPGGHSIPKPVKVVLARDEIGKAIKPDPGRPQEVLQAMLDRESNREGLVIYSAEHAAGPAGLSLRLKFKTLDTNASYWLDTGTLWTNHG